MWVAGLRQQHCWLAGRRCCCQPAYRAKHAWASAARCVCLFWSALRKCSSSGRSAKSYILPTHTLLLLLLLPCVRVLSLATATATTRSRSLAPQPWRSSPTWSASHRAGRRCGAPHTWSRHLSLSQWHVSTRVSGARQHECLILAAEQSVETQHSRSRSCEYTQRLQPRHYPHGRPLRAGAASLPGALLDVAVVQLICD